MTADGGGAIDGERRKAGGATIVRYRDVVKRYGAFTALRGVSISMCTPARLCA